MAGATCHVLVLAAVLVASGGDILLDPGDEANVVPEHYLIMLREESRLSELTTFNIPSVELKQKFHIGNLRIILAKSDHQGLQSLLRSNMVDAIEPEQMLSAPTIFEHIHVLQPSRTQWKHKDLTYNEKPPALQTHNVSIDRHFLRCYQDYIGRFGWGLIRSSYVELPDFETTPFLYGADDGTGVDIYVLDTGVKVEHEDFEGRAVHGMTALNVSHEGNQDLSGHGTFVAGVAAGELFGMAKNSNIIAVKVLDRDTTGPTSAIIEGLEWAVNDIMSKRRSQPARRSVINMALGGRGPLYTVESVLQAIADMNIIIVTSAGNGYIDACYVSPARISSIITVGATDNKDSFAKTSNYGPCVDIFAPGESIAGPHIIVPYAIESGTSSAAPHVAGVIARHLSVMSDEEVLSLTPARAKALMVDTALLGVINMFGFPWLTSTPNRLLQKPCVEIPIATKPPDPDTEKPTSPTQTTSEDINTTEEDKTHMFSSSVPPMNRPTTLHVRKTTPSVSRQTFATTRSTTTQVTSPSIVKTTPTSRRTSNRMTTSSKHSSFTPSEPGATNHATSIKTTNIREEASNSSWSINMSAIILPVIVGYYIGQSVN